MLNTNLRTKDKNDFEKDFKLMNKNAVFGKTIEKIQNRVDIQLVTDDNKALKLIRKPNFKNNIIVNKNLLSVEKKKASLEFNKSIYVRFSILDLSKCLVYEFYYDVMLKNYGKSLKLLSRCYQDTDNLIYKVQTKDIYNDMNKSSLKEWFDFSDYLKDHLLYDELNKKVIGKFKDELNGRIRLLYTTKKQYKIQNLNNK